MQATLVWKSRKSGCGADSPFLHDDPQAANWPWFHNTTIMFRGTYDRIIIDCPEVLVGELEKSCNIIVRSLRESLSHNLNWADEILIWVGNNIYPIISTWWDKKVSSWVNLRKIVIGWNLSITRDNGQIAFKKANFHDTKLPIVLISAYIFFIRPVEFIG